VTQTYCSADTKLPPILVCSASMLHEQFFVWRLAQLQAMLR
jgi:hypothetical protein